MENKMDSWEQIETERNDLLTKLSKIEERKATVSHDVYEKVKSEYAHRLKMLEEKLVSNAELMKVEVARMQEENNDLSAREKDIRLMLEEVELRYSIGEYNAEEYDTKSAEYKNELEELLTKLDKIKGKIKKFESITTTAAKPEPNPEPEPEPDLIDVADIQEIAEPVTEETKIEIKEEAVAETTPHEDSGLKIDEHILASSVTEQVKQLDELLTEAEAVKEPAAAGSTEPGKTAPAKKTEKGVTCPKCGQVNTPDSWYCEKCGAEILEGPA